MFNYASPGGAKGLMSKLTICKTGLLRSRCIGLAIAVSLMLAGCATPQSTRFYTLSSPPLPASAEQAKPAAVLVPIYIEVSPVAMPERFKRPQLVINTQADTAQVKVLEQDRWTSPFNEEMRDALTSQISTHLHAVDISRGGRPMNQAFYRVAVVLHTLDVLPGNRIYANFGWTIKPIGKQVSTEENGASLENTDNTQIVVCQTTINKPVGGSIEATVKSMQEAVAEVALQISTQLKSQQQASANMGNAQCMN